jgi:Family of unknown function (DUF6062)
MDIVWVLAYVRDGVALRIMLLPALWDKDSLETARDNSTSRPNPRHDPGSRDVRSCFSFLYRRSTRPGNFPINKERRSSRWPNPVFRSRPTVCLCRRYLLRLSPNGGAELAYMNLVHSKHAIDERPFWPYFTAFDAALGQPGCVVCNHLEQCERKAINEFLYETMMDPDVRGRFHEAGLFCRKHFDLAIEIERECWPRGGVVLALFCQDSIGRASESFERSSCALGTVRPRLQLSSSSQNSTSGERCTFCAEQRSAESSFLAALEDLMNFDGVREDLTPGRLCLGHTHSAIESWRDDAKCAHAAALARKYMQELHGDLAECVRKYDHRFREETSGREREAVPRSVRFLKGGICLR